MIAITIDVEWAPDPVLADTLELLNEYDVAATLFSTHDDGVEAAGHERALHPNFEGDLNAASAVDDLLDVYPGAIGYRSHRLAISSPLRATLAEKGLRYESNYMTYLVPDLSPFRMPAGITQFPVYWMDDVWFRSEQAVPDVASLVAGEGLRVFDFHPPHVYYNTPSLEYYETHKDDYWEKPNEEIRYTGTGVRDIFVSLLEYVDGRDHLTATLADLCDDDGVPPAPDRRTSESENA